MSNRNKYLIILFSLLAICTTAFTIYKFVEKPIDPLFDAENDIKHGDIHLINYGLPINAPDELNSKKKLDSIEKQLGFYWKNYGCIVDSESNALAKQYNDKIIQYLNKRNGKDWFIKYTYTADSIYKNVK